MVVPVGGKPGLSDEAADVGYFSVKDLKSMDVKEYHSLRIPDALAGFVEAFVL
ncbi:MAG: hypothetical protein VX608_14335 [Chloroflexota bacterium]|nr:hypothetical protein [Chloroflexota bacterium]